MKNITILQKEFTPYISANSIKQAVKQIGEQMNKELYSKNPLFIVVLNGSFMFASDLMKTLQFECSITFVKLSSYLGTESTGEIKKHFGLVENIEGRTIIIIEDIIDTGATLYNFINSLKEQKPAEIKVATMFIKPRAMKYQITVDYSGIEIDNDFVVGYGLDYDGLGRNLPELYKIES